MTRWTSKDIGIARNESELQQIAVKWFRYSYPSLTMRLYAIPNGGQRSKATAGRLKAEGVVSGVWDLHLCVPMNGYNGLYIETKFGKNSLTANQIAFREANKSHHKFEVYYTLDQFKDIIKNYLLEA